MTAPLTINGFKFKVCNAEKSFSHRFYQASNGIVTIKSKNLNYLVSKVKKLDISKSQ